MLVSLVLMVLVLLFLVQLYTSLCKCVIALNAVPLPFLPVKLTELTCKQTISKRALIESRVSQVERKTVVCACNNFTQLSFSFIHTQFRSFKLARQKPLHLLLLLLLPLLLLLLLLSLLSFFSFFLARKLRLAAAAADYGVLCYGKRTKRVKRSLRSQLAVLKSAHCVSSAAKLTTTESNKTFFAS